MNIFSLVISIAAVGIAWLSWWTTKQTLRHNAIREIRKDYLSPEMYHAIKTLWQFYRENNEKGENFVDKYEKIRGEEEKWVSGQDKQNRVTADQSTLHYQRRLVKEFYVHLASLRASNILPASMVFREWPEEDLRIIPEIIVPIETKLNEVFHKPPLPEVDENNFPPLKLYNDSKRYKEFITGQRP